jgi:hypothetical protein
MVVITNGSCLILEQFEFDFTPHLADLKMALSGLRQRFQALGCKVGQKKREEGSPQLIAKLTVPLTFPSFTPRKKRSN